MTEYQRVAQRAAFASRKQPFDVLKAALLECKSSPFALQKQPFYKVKGLLLETGCSIARDRITNNGCIVLVYRELKENRDVLHKVLPGR